MNTIRTALLISALTALFVAVGWIIGGASGMVVAFLMAAAMNAFAYWNADRIVLAMHGARPVDRASAAGLYQIVERLAARAGLPMPRVYLIESQQPNAFATGRDPQHAAIAATTALIEMLSEEELAGVLAHELSHVKHHDTLIMTITATIAGAIGMLVNLVFLFGSGNSRQRPLGPFGGILVALLAPVAATLVQLAISRTREYEADREGAEICGHPLWLADALAKIDHGVRYFDNPTAEANPATAHLFIVNPLHGRGLESLFATHPSIEDRIRRLRAMAGASRGPWG